MMLQAVFGNLFAMAISIAFIAMVVGETVLRLNDKSMFPRAVARARDRARIADYRRQEAIQQAQIDVVDIKRQQLMDIVRSGDADKVQQALRELGAPKS